MRIAITQRVEQVPGYEERRDCLDQRWTSLMEGLGIDLLPIPNGLQSPASWLERQAVAGLILSGGNDLCHLPNATNTSAERDFTERELLAKAKELRLPVMGVCRGMQALNHFLGGTLAPVTGHVNCMHTVHGRAETQEPFLAYSSVNSFHGWGVHPGNLAENLLAQVWAEDGTIEAFVHAHLPWMAIMWHPERPSSNTLYDAKLIRQFFFGKDTPCA
ncbi:gamma-glutamyl-gamma-aminobutyrate hydrolase family protein [Pseudomonas proteolytica]|uniref:gamma-glutamyl-gamma-aminobutyrate hydrolase family protein n=1 Tax=Pseudomonas proteolytica TaxID=219574 RepID=UPI0023DF1DD6|nr:gamma-glutamyl-gamma-aminobutyrate hydrolase family protein [Pseudomonas proteolytica]MDF3162406.1 gamma-glutamyl-gamma-aminobutyrate hydrolase family protein [Pseudomonas proteolytica]